jgi:hypothetical protein
MGDCELFALVMMPFDPKFDDIYRIGIQEVAQFAGFAAQRLDEQIYREGMLDRLYQQIEIADLIIADMSNKNPNVFYEVGFAHAKDKLCILLTSDSFDIPFDLKHRRHIVYGSSLSRLRDLLRKDLEWARDEILRRRSSILDVKHQIGPGSSRVTTYSVEGTVTLYTDLYNNETGPRHVELHAVYMYLSGDGWRLSQHGRECPSTRSELTGFLHKYLLSPPVARLHNGGWAQISIEGMKVLASKWGGEPSPDALIADETALLRIVTDTGAIDHHITLRVDFNNAASDASTVR